MSDLSETVIELFKLFLADKQVATCILLTSVGFFLYLTLSGIAKIIKAQKT